MDRPIIMHSGLRTTASDQLYPTSAHLQSAVSAAVSKQRALGKNGKGSRKTKHTNVRAVGKLNSGQTAWHHRLSKAVGITVKITVSHQPSKRVTFDGGTIKRFSNTLCMLLNNN